MDKHVIIDTDIGFDPDDFIALLLCLNSELCVELVLTGGFMREQGYNLARKVLDLTYSDAKLCRGADTINGELYDLCDSEIEDLLERHEYLERIDEVVQNNKEVYYVGIGPMTSVANYLRTHKHKNFTLVQMGLSSKREEFNLLQDYDAGVFALSSGIESRIVTADVTNNEKNRASSFFLERVKSSSLPVHKLLYENIKRMPNFYLHDPLTIASVIDESIVSFTPAIISFKEGHQEFKQVKHSNTLISSSADYNKIVDMIDTLAR